MKFRAASLGVLCALCALCAFALKVPFNQDQTTDFKVFLTQRRKGRKGDAKGGRMLS